MTVPVPEPIVESAYCAIGDLRTGDIRLPGYIDPAQRVVGAAEEIDIAIGHIYKTPVTFPDPVPLESRPSVLMLKKVNWLIASGRIILDMAAAGENVNQHAYGMGMLKEGLAMLKVIASGETQLVKAIKLDLEPGQLDYTGPVIHNEDPSSLVEAFYTGSLPMPYGVSPGRTKTIYGDGPPA